MDNHTQKSFKDVWLFVASVLVISFVVSYLKAYRHVASVFLFAPFYVGLLAFFFQLFVRQQPIIELYTKGYPYRKLKPYGAISAILLFEFILIWGLHTKDILPLGKDLFLITIVFVGVIAYYHLFVRMKISLRFLFLALLIPFLSIGTTLGLGSYLNVLEFVIPTKKIGDIVFFNTAYWILTSVFLQIICEEPAFRGYLMQRLLDKSELSAIVFSSLLYAVWRMPFTFLPNDSWNIVVFVFCGNFTIGAILSLLFIKGKNLLVAILCRGIVDGLLISLFASSAYPGIRQYIRFIAPRNNLLFMAIGLGCLLIGLLLLTIVPRKKSYVS